MITGENPRAFEQRVLGGNVTPFLSWSSSGAFGVEDTRDLLNSHLISPDATDDTERGLLSS